MICYKGGGHSTGFRASVGLPPRHRHWTETTDIFPRTDGVGPKDGGLPKPPDPWTRFKRWVSYYRRWLTGTLR